MTVTFTAGQKLRASDLQAIIDDTVKVAKASSTTRNNTAALTADPELVLPLKANYTYIVRIVAFSNSGTTPDIKFSITFPAGATTPFGGVRQVDTSAGPTGNIDTGAYNSATSATDAIAAAGAGFAQTTLLECTVKMSGTAGNLTLNWAQSTANASNTILYAGSSMTAHRIR